MVSPSVQHENAAVLSRETLVAIGCAEKSHLKYRRLQAHHVQWPDVAGGKALHGTPATWCAGWWCTSTAPPRWRSTDGAMS